MLKREIIDPGFHGKVLDNPEVKVWDGDFNKAIKVFKIKVSRLGLFSELKRRRLDPGVSARRKAKKVTARNRLLNKQKKVR